MKKKKSATDIQEACAYVYQLVASIIFGDHKLKDIEEVRILDILSAVASGDKIPHEKFWRIK